MTRLVAVIGHHRGGTSATAGALRRVGVHFGADYALMPASEANPKGYTEHLGVVRAHEALLRALGLTWDAVGPLPSGWRTSLPYVKVRAELCTIMHDLAYSHSVIGVKDPRMARLLPLWQDVARHTGMALCPLVVQRELKAVSASLQRREDWDESTAWQFVSQQQAGLEEWMDMPGAAVAMFPDLLSWRVNLWPQVRRLVDYPDLALSVEKEQLVDTFLDAKMVHHG